MSKFFMLWNPEGTTPPKQKYSTYQQAHAAACKMASKHRKPFYIMEAKAVIQTQVSIVKTNLTKG